MFFLPQSYYIHSVMCSVVRYTIGDVFNNTVDTVSVPLMSSLISLPQPLLTSLTSNSLYICLCQKADLGLLEPSLSTHTTVPGTSIPPGRALNKWLMGMEVQKSWIPGSLGRLCYNVYFITFPMFFNGNKLWLSTFLKKYLLLTVFLSMYHLLFPTQCFYTSLTYIPFLSHSMPLGKTQPRQTSTQFHTWPT